MQIILTKYVGFCNGVQHSIDIALREKEQDKTVYLNHPLIHNKMVTSLLAEMNVIYDKTRAFRAGDTVVISAHGASEKLKQELKNNHINVVDATCPLVKKIHDKVGERYLAGDKIYIFGDKDHVEIKSITEDYPESKIVESEEEIDFSSPGSVFIVTQTTFNTVKAGIIKKNLEKKAEFSEKKVVFFDSICYTTHWRQVEADSISAKSDFVLVVGDATSSNTNKLLEICKRNCKDTFLIENVSDLNSVQIDTNYKVCGIVSAASTPKELVMEVFNRMNEVNTTEKKVEEMEATAVAPEQEAANEEVQTMAEAMKKYSSRTYREGMRITAKIISVDPTGISVAIEGGGKNDSGFITREEAEIDGTFDPANYKVGDEVKCIIIPKEQGSKNTAINLSKKAFDISKLDDERVQRIIAGEEFTMSNMSVVKGGLLGKIGSYTVFVPASHIRLGYVQNLEDYTKKTLRLKAIPPKEEEAEVMDEEGNVKKRRNNKRIIASQRIILEKEKQEQDDAFWASIYEGAIVQGVVKRFTKHGAFVKLKQHMDALVPATELSWSKKRISDPAEVLELNKTYDFIVIKADRYEKRKTRKKPDGSFVEEEGVITLSYKQLQKKPHEIAQEKYPVGTVLTGKVARLVDYGAFVEIEPGIDGLVHISQIKNGWIEKPSEVLKEGDEVQVKIMSYDGERITLSIKELLPVEEESAKEVSDDKEDNVAPRAKKADKKFNKKNKEVAEEDNEPRQYVSEKAGVTLGDIFKNLTVASDDSEDSDK